MKKKRGVFIWYSVEAGNLFELDLEATADLISMMIRHDFGFNKTMMYMGVL